IIEIGDVNDWSYNFYSASLELKNLPRLESIAFGKHSFDDCTTLALENLPELQSIHFGMNSFAFAAVDSSSLIMRNLPKLKWFTVDNKYSETLQNVHRVVCENIPSLKSLTITSTRAFSNVKDFSVKG
ncbi:hypothetical protein WA577_007144, partial [Blastocystis sp. JDR]